MNTKDIEKTFFASYFNNIDNIIRNNKNISEETKSELLQLLQLLYYEYKKTFNLLNDIIK